ncbi:MAG TPA: thiamine phosphate synthase, partial [Planctomycetota bacterium]|nr:thiamine phosphate synthase [Planctomycetota bacterium]
MLVFTPELCELPIEALEQVWASVDVVQIRPKALGDRSSEPTSARSCYEWAQRVLDLAQGRPGPRPLLLVNDRVDVAQALAQEGIDGVHLGQHDTPSSVAREVLGSEPLIGLSTHNYREVREAEGMPVDY